MISFFSTLYLLGSVLDCGGDDGWGVNGIVDTLGVNEELEGEG